MPIVAQSTASAQSESSIPLPPLPPFLLGLLAPYLAVLLAWLGEHVLAHVRRSEADHPLFQIDRYLDLDPVVTACAAYQHTHGPGAPPTFPLATLVRAEIVRAYAESCSSPALAQHLRSNLVVRAFVGLPLFGPSPSPSTLDRFHAWLCRHQPDTLFRHVLRFLDQVDPEDPATTPQIIDTFGMHAPAAAQSPAVILMRLSARLAIHWQRHDPVTATALPPDLDLARLRTAREARGNAKAARQLGYAIGDARRVLTALTEMQARLTADLRADLTTIADQIRKVIADDTTTDADGTPVERPHGRKGSARIVSATDPEAGFRKHGDDLTLGYNAAISVTATRIRSVVAMTGCTPDSVAPERLLAQQQAAGQSLPAQVIMDMAGGQGKTRAAVDQISKGQTTMIARLMPAGGADPQRFQPADFRVTFAADGTPTDARCPAGQVTTTVHRQQRDDGWHARFTVARHCAGCAQWTACRPADGKPTGHRSVFISRYHHYQRQAAAFNASDDGQVLLRSRWRVEPVVQWLAGYQGCRRARRVGVAAALGQLYQACAVRNLQHWLSRLRRGLARAPV